MPEDEIYVNLARHLSSIYFGWQPNWWPLERASAIVESMIRANLDPTEAEVLLSIPVTNIPMEIVSLDDITRNMKLPRDEAETVLERLSSRGFLYSGKTKDGKQGYSIVRATYGSPMQTIFWRGVNTESARKTAEHMLPQQFNPKGHLVRPEPTKGARYIPVNKAIEVSKQAVYTFDMIEEAIRKANVIAVGHCVCRMIGMLTGNACNHPIEVCMKYDGLAEHMIRIGAGREVSKDEAREIIKKSEEAGLVHFVDNAQEGLLHNCNCCGCWCWNVGAIKRRTVPRDMLMSTYFLRETDKNNCQGCGTCIDICPVDVLKIENGFCQVDKEWCIGCGVCVQMCPNSAIRLVRKTDQVPPKDFVDLHDHIFKENLEIVKQVQTGERRANIKE